MKKLLRKYPDPILIHRDYIDVLLRLAGYRLSDLSVTILAYSSYRKALTSETKKEIAEKFNTSIQVISNTITKLRKQQLLLKNNLNPKLKPENDNQSALTIYFTLEPKTKIRKTVLSESNITEQTPA
jgi:DNA replication protein DnaD